MAVNKEQVEAEAKKLGLTLNDDQIKAYITIGELPVKRDSAPPAGDDDDDDDATPEEKEKIAKSKIIQDRLAKEKVKRAAIAKERDEAQAKLRKFEDEQAAKGRTDAESKGQYEKLKGELEASKSKYDSGLTKIMDDFKSTVIKGKLETELLAAGVPKDRLAKAVKAFEMDHADKVNFEWTDKEKYAYELDETAISEAVSTFKTENGYFFTEPENDGEEFVPRKAGGAPKPKGSADKKAAELKARHSRLFA